MLLVLGPTLYELLLSPSTTNVRAMSASAFYLYLQLGATAIDRSRGRDFAASVRNYRGEGNRSTVAFEPIGKPINYWGNFE